MLPMMFLLLFLPTMFLLQLPLMSHLEHLDRLMVVVVVQVVVVQVWVVYRHPCRLPR